MPLVQNLQKLVARLNALPSKFGVETYQDVLIKYTNQAGIDLTIPITPNPNVELVKPQQIGKFLSASVEVFQGDLVVSEITRYQTLIDPASTQTVLSKGKYLYNNKVYFCTHLDTTDTVFYTAYIREDRINR
jgi:hypothetical protein